MQRNEPTEAEMKALWATVEMFIIDHDIHCPETIYQTDRVIENAYTFIEDVCNIVGYEGDEDDAE